MTASLHAIGAGVSAGHYYTRDAIREGPRRDEYYSQDAGQWWTTGQTLVAHDAAIDPDSFHDLCAGRNPTTGSSAVRGAGAEHRAGWDVTLTACKSFSVLWASAGPNQRHQLEALHAAAVSEALEFLADERLVEVRLGAGGYRREASTDLIVGRFQHYTTRAGDPGLHTHCVLLNVAGSADGHWRTLEPKKLYEWQLAIGSAYRAALSERLARDFGLSLREAGQGQYEIRGIPQSVIDVFSKRSNAIKAKIGGDRSAASAAQKEIAALGTRGAKADLPTGKALEARWRVELAPFDIDPWQAVRDAAREVSPPREPDLDLAFDPPEIAGDTPVAIAVSALCRHQNVLDRKTLLERALDEAALQGIGIAAVRTELANLEARGQLVRLDAQDRDACWTTPGIAAAEAVLLRAADRPEVSSRFDPAAILAAFAAAPHLSAEQRMAIETVTGLSGVSILEAGAGTGKTTTARAIVDAAERSGLKIVGLAPSWKAADELSASTGIPSLAIAKWRHDLHHGHSPPLEPNTLVICDESGMVGTKDLAFVLETVAAVPGGRAILLGDRRQLASVSGASALRAVVDVLGRIATLAEVRRQVSPWQRAASILMARGDVEAGLRAYGRQDRIELVAGPADSQTRAIARWSEARARHGDAEVVMVTRRNRDAAALNQAAREVLRSEGTLSGADLAVEARDRQNTLATLLLARGDRIRFGENLIRHGIRNGTQATVETIAADRTGTLRLRVHLDDGRVVEDAYEQFSQQRPGAKTAAHRVPRISLAYAGTVYSVQGRTAAACVFYGATALDAREIYVGLTRHRHEAWLVVERDRLVAAVRTRSGDPCLQPSTAELHERLFAEARRYAEKINVVDCVEDRRQFVRSGIIPPSRSDLRLDVTRAFEAARTLRTVLHEIGAAPGLAVGYLARWTRDVLKHKVPQRFVNFINTIGTLKAISSEREAHHRQRSDHSIDI